MSATPAWEETCPPDRTVWLWLEVSGQRDSYKPCYKHSYNWVVVHSYKHTAQDPSFKGTHRDAGPQGNVFTWFLPRRWLVLWDVLKRVLREVSLRHLRGMGLGPCGSPAALTLWRCPGLASAPWPDSVPQRVWTETGTLRDSMEGGPLGSRFLG